MLGDCAEVMGTVMYESIYCRLLGPAEEVLSDFLEKKTNFVCFICLSGFVLS